MDDWGDEKRHPTATWSLRSESDPRWDASGTCGAGDYRPREAEMHVAQKTKELGEPPPDLKIECWRNA